MTIALIDYGAGNLTSVQKALRHVGATPRVVSGDVSDLSWAGAIVVPGVGHFGATRAIAAPCRREIGDRVAAGVPILGICLGMQWLFQGSDEAPNLPGFGAFDGRCVHLTGAEKIPHVGWNQLERTSRPSRLLAQFPEGGTAYFTHSYAVALSDASVARTTHGISFTSVVERDRIFGAQFHPEKSGTAGLKLLASFVALAREVTVSC